MPHAFTDVDFKQERVDAVYTIDNVTYTSTERLKCVRSRFMGFVCKLEYSLYLIFLSGYFIVT